MAKEHDGEGDGGEAAFEFEADAPGPATEQALDDELAEQLEARASLGREHLASVGDDAPESVVRALENFVVTARDTLETEATEEIEELALDLGAWYGTLICAAHGWNWCQLDYGDGELDLAVVSPDRALALYPIEKLHATLLETDEPPTLARLFEFLKKPDLAAQAGSYTILT